MESGAEKTTNFRLQIKIMSKLKGVILVGVGAASYGILATIDDLKYYVIHICKSVIQKIYF